MSIDPLDVGERRVVTVEGEPVAVFNVEGQYRAIGNRCPHRGGPLSRGRLEPLPPEASPSGGVAVRCPIHGWLFDLATGRCLNQPEASVPAYRVTCRDGAVSISR